MARPDVLVTGASGLIGTALVDRLLESEKLPAVLTRNRERLPKRWESRVIVRQGDLSKPHTLAGSADAVQAVFHLAGELRVPELFDAVNREGTERLIEISRQAGVRNFLYMSSVGVIGSRGRPGVINETTPERPTKLYEISKYRAERAVIAANDLFGMRTVALRPSIVYGERTYFARDSFLRLVQLVKRGRLALLGEGYVSSYVYVGDVVAACLALLWNTKGGGETFIVNEPISLTDFVDEIAAVLNTRTPCVMPEACGRILAALLKRTGRFASLHNRSVYSMEKLKSSGFSLPYGYRVGLRNTINCYLRSGNL